MILTQATVYGIYGLVYLVKQPEGKSVSLSEVSSTVKLPTKFLAKIFQALVRSGLIRSYRGARGGFRLNRPKEKINLAEIIESIQGPIQFARCLNNKTEHANRAAYKLGKIFQEIQDYCHNKLESKTLVDFM